MLKDDIEAKLKEAVRAGEGRARSVFRMLLAAIHNQELEKRRRSGRAEAAALTGEEVLAVIRTELKKRGEAALAYAEGGRAEAAAAEEAEAAILQSFLPAELSDQELMDLARTGAAELGATGERDFGKLMGWMKGTVAGRAVGERVAAAARRLLSHDAP